MDKLYSLSRISSEPRVDSVEDAKQSLGNGRAMHLLIEASNAWHSMATLRANRNRCKNYVYGNQWSDKIIVDGKKMSEEEYIRSQGQVPLTNNLIRRFVRSVIGVYRGQSKEPICVARDRAEQSIGETMSTVLQYNMQLNKMNDLLARTMEDFLIGGFVCHRKWYGWRNGRRDCWTDVVSPDMFFIDVNSVDYRGWDASFIGQIHDISFSTLCQMFAGGHEDVEKLKAIYHRSRNMEYVSSFYRQFGESPSLRTFFHAMDTTQCRVIEVWKKEQKGRYEVHDPQNGAYYKIEVEDYAAEVLAVNEKRRQQGLAAGMREDEIPYIRAKWFVDDYWYFYYLSPFGDILKEGETPYAHESHPFVFKAYPFLDGEIHSFVADFIDQQRYVNRLITMYDWIMRSSAKGVLVFPEEALSDQMTINEIADEWTRYNGVIIAKTKSGAPLPQQISANSTNIGIGDLLNLQLKFLEDISGVHGSLQGKPGYSQMSASLYAQQSQNATTSLLDILETFSSFVVDGAYKDVKNIQQFYEEEKVFNISGKSNKITVYDPEKVSDIEFDLSIVESTTSPAYRQAANDFLLQIWNSGQINLEQLLEHGDFPFSDELLQSVKTMKEEALKNGSPIVAPEQQAGVPMPQS